MAAAEADEREMAPFERAGLQFSEDGGAQFEDFSYIGTGVGRSLLGSS